MDNLTIFLDNLKILMKEQNLSYEELGEKLNMSSSAMREWSNGALPTIESLYKLAVYFDISVDYLLGLSQNMEFTPCKNPSNFISRYDCLLRQNHLRDINIAKLLHTGTSTITGWRNGKTPVLTTLIQLCKIFDCSFSYLVGISDD